METWELKQKQSLSLEIKIEMSKRRISDWYDYWNGNVYVSFSGGKDSTVLLHLIRSIYPEIKAVFVDTGLEYPEIRNFVKTIDNVEWIRPKKSFKCIIDKYGYPVVSKEQALYIRQYRNTKSEYLRNVRWNGKNSINGKGTSKYGKISEKWKFLVNAPFKISEECCNHIKKQPLNTYNKKTNMKPYIGTMASDSRIRKNLYLRNGCNTFDSKYPASKPLSFWLENDIWNYIKTNNIKYSKIYDMGYERTGCMFCMFGVHMENFPNRFELMKETHPKSYDYCINNLGLGCVLDYLRINYGKTQQIKFN